MSHFADRILPLSLLATVVTVVGGAITWSVLASSKLSDGPAEIVYDKAACAACGMHVGDPSFAAQLTTKDGRVHAFDDPGCLLLFVAEQQPQVHSMFFRHHRENRWLAGASVGFVAMEKTPMGFGLAAVDGTEPGTMDLEQARAKCLARSGGHGVGR